MLEDRHGRDPGLPRDLGDRDRVESAFQEQPENRTTIGTALVDTATEVTSGAGIAITGTILATLFTGDLATSHWSPRQTGEFHQAVTVAGLTLTTVAAALVGWGIARTRNAAADQAATPIGDTVPQDA
ncbi:hypothetical protein AB0K16_42345 [Nonomuraea jabiensis]|uniref:hypothetical protein n=1 Tax=Nonomuraea jabiensis TaxID=882448 RepID=UPI00343214A4